MLDWWKERQNSESLVKGWCAVHMLYCPYGTGKPYLENCEFESWLELGREA